MTEKDLFESCRSFADSGAHPSHSIGRILVAVYPVTFYDKHLALLDALQDIFFVSFRPCKSDEIGDFRFALLCGAVDDVLSDAQKIGVRCLVFPLGESETTTCCPGEVAFADVSVIEQTIRGQCFVENEPLEIASILVRPGDDVLATRSGSPIWIRRNCGSVSMDFLAIEPRVLGSRELLCEHLHPRSVSHLLPMLHFIREAAGEGNWDSGPRRACFIIDDPSLYHPSYSYVHFRQIAAHAKEHGYHVAIATIALDTWWVHHEVASVFRDYPEQISLIIHGNNHVYLEMCRSRCEAEFLAIAAQALRRFSRLEKQHGITFSRVMEAPHGVIGIEAFGPLVSLGYEAALFTPSQFINWNRNACWLASFGSSPVDVFPKGLCAVPRLVMSEEWRADVMIAAFLRQPIVLAGHHQDLFAGLELLSEFATLVNRLGNVRWFNLSEIAKSSFTSRREGSTWVVRMGARVVECHVPPGVTQVVIERLWVLGEAEQMTMYGLYETGEPLFLLAGAVSEPLPWRLEAGGKLIIESPPRVAISPNSVASPPKRIWHIVRKILVEARDRFHLSIPRGVPRRFQSKSKLFEMSHQKPTTLK